MPGRATSRPGSRAPGRSRDRSTSPRSRAAQPARSPAQTRALTPLLGKPLSDASVTHALRAVQGSGSYNALFETFSTAHPQAVAAAAAVSGPDTGVLVRLSHVRNGPPFCSSGPTSPPSPQNVTPQHRSTFRFIDQDVGGFGSELRADLRLGFLTQFSGEYYRLLTPNGYFVQPHLGLLREPVYLWQNQRRISERFSQHAGGGFDVGRTVSRNLQVAAEWRTQVIRWHLTSGVDADPKPLGHLADPRSCT